MYHLTYLRDREIERSALKPISSHIVYSVFKLKVYKSKTHILFKRLYLNMFSENNPSMNVFIYINSYYLRHLQM